MKQCPTCRRSYADDTLRFCLEDGTELNLVGQSPGDDPHRTEKFPDAVTQAAHNAARVNVPTAQTAAPRPTQQTSNSSSLVLKILIGIVTVAVVVVIAAAGLIFALYYLGSRESTIVSTQTPTPVPSVSPSPYVIALDPNNPNNLEDKLKELQKKLDEATSSNSSNEIPWDPDDLRDYGRTAKVNSPKDGFLALRNLPSTEIGSLLAKIPHGTTIKVLICSEQAVTIGGREGHWCMVSYDDKTGWVFDVWLTFATDSKN